MPEEKKIHGEPTDTPIGWGVTVKPSQGSNAVINGFWMVHSGTGVLAANSAAALNQLPIPASGAYIGSILSTGSKDGWTFVWADAQNNLWMQDNDYLIGSSSGSYDLPYPSDNANCTGFAITLTPTMVASGSTCLTIWWSYTDSKGIFQNGNLSPINGYQNMLTFD